MNKQLSFISNGKRYTTIVGADAYLQSAKEPGSNVVDCGKIQASGGLNTAFKRLFGKPVKDVPLIQNAIVQTVGAVYNVKGQAMIDGKLLDVSISEDTILIQNEEASVVDEASEKSTVDETVIEKTNTSPVEDPVETEVTAKEDIPVEESVEKESVKVEDEAPVAEMSDDVSTPQSVEEETRTSAEPINLSESKGAVVELEKDTEPSVTVTSSIKMPEIKTPGLHLGKAGKVEKEIVIGGCSNNISGVTFDGKMYPHNTATIIASRSPFRKPDAHDRYFGQRPSYKPEQNFDEPLEQRVNKAMKEKMEAAIEPEMIAEETTEKKNQELMQEWSNTTAPDITRKWDVPQAITEENVSVPEQVIDEPKVLEDMEAVKKQLRAKFSPEVNAVIGMIPHACLDAISEFTSREVDAKLLEDRGNIYCIDNRWFKCGAWFCIDVVPNVSRFFYNHKNKIMIEIPISDCKAWLNAVK